MKNGYTLIEVLTTIAIFGLISGSIVGLFVSSLQAQRKALASQKLFDNISYTIEYMSRAIRMAKKDDLPGSTLNCLSGYRVNYETRNSRSAGSPPQNYSGLGIVFKSYKTIPTETCEEFFWDTNDARLKYLEFSAAPLPSPPPLTPSNIRVNSFNISMSGQDQGDGSQPRITISMDIETKGGKSEQKTKIKIQTTISQRNLDVTY